MLILLLKQLICQEVEKSIPNLGIISVDRQRMMFMGKELPNTAQITEGQFDDSKVIQVFLRPLPK